MTWLGVALLLVVAYSIYLAAVHEPKPRNHHTGLMSGRSYCLDENGDIIDDSP